MSDSLDEQLAEVRSIAMMAGDMLLASLDSVGAIEQKAATEIVTEVDRRVEDAIVERVSRWFVGDTIEAEESGKRAGATDRTWYIDPLDGTTNYAHGQPVFAVSMACADADGLLLAGVYAPYLDELYLARRGGGARLERPQHGVQKELPKRKNVSLDQALLATGFPYVRDDAVDLNTNRVRDFLRAHCHGVRRAGSAAMDLVHVAAGKLDGYWETTLRSWDTAAGTLIAREAGAVVSDQSGVEEAMHYKNILAAAPGLHAVMREILAQSTSGKEQV